MSIRSLSIFAAVLSTGLLGCAQSANILMVNPAGEAVYCSDANLTACADDGYHSVVEAGFVGIEIDTVPPFRILKVTDPAILQQDAMIEGGDLLAVGNTEVTDYGQALNLLFGSPGSRVDFTVSHRGSRSKIHATRSKYVHPENVAIRSYQGSSSYSGSAGAQQHVGPRGGVYHYSKSGKKVYDSSSGKSKGKSRK